MLPLPFKLNQAGRRHIPRQKRKVTNWPAYDASLRQRGSLTVWFTDEAIAAWEAEPRTTPGGQPHYSDLAIMTVLPLKAVFRLALRQTEGLIGSIIHLLGLALSVPDHTTLSRRAETLEGPRPRSDGRTDAGRDPEPLHLLVDSTGLKLCGAGEWLVEKHGTRTRRAWRKMHIGVDADTGQIVAATLTTHDVDDGSQVGPLLDQVDGPIASFTGDGAYDLRIPTHAGHLFRDDVGHPVADFGAAVPAGQPPRHPTLDRQRGERDAGQERADHAPTTTDVAPCPRRGERARDRANAGRRAIHRPGQPQ